MPDTGAGTGTCYFAHDMILTMCVNGRLSEVHTQQKQEHAHFRLVTIILAVRILLQLSSALKLG